MTRRAARLFVRGIAAAAGFLFATAWAQTPAQPGAWAIKDDEYRAVIRAGEPPAVPDAGVAIEIPEFGQTRDDLHDVVLTDETGIQLPFGIVYRGAGDRVLVLARPMKQGKDYYLYFGGGRHIGVNWLPRISLLLETRRLPADTQFDSWEMLRDVWERTADVEGMGFIPTIYLGDNPFAERWNFLSHSSGYLNTRGLSDIFLYTLSADASFVFVNDAYQFGWPGRHSPSANAGSVTGKDVPVTSEWTKIDYFQAKGDVGWPPAMVLGWKRDGKVETIPSTAWLHPGASTVQGIETRHARPTPLAIVTVHSYIGYGAKWYYDTECSLAPQSAAGWTVQWAFDDGPVYTGTSCRRVIASPTTRMVTLTLTRDDIVVKGSRRIAFGGDIPVADVNNNDDVAWYVHLLNGETPSPLSGGLESDLLFLRDFGDVETLGKFAGAWLKQNLNPKEPLWIDAETAWLRWLGETDPKKALSELHSLSPEAQQDWAAWLDPLEMDLLVFCDRNPGAEDRIRQIALKNMGTPLERMSDIRMGDLYRLRGSYKEAADQYLAAQKGVIDDSESRKLPAEDRAFSITISGLIEKGFRTEAAQKLEEWEYRHPMAKLDSDFLLLRARDWMLFGRWKEALAEIDSFEKMQADSPYAIDAEFYRARILFETGQKDEARKIWNGLAKDFPNNELATESRVWAAKP